jgi:hypothetical protein
VWCARSDRVRISPPTGPSCCATATELHHFEQRLASSRSDVRIVAQVQRLHAEDTPYSVGDALDARVVKVATAPTQQAHLWHGGQGVKDAAK